MLKQKDIDFFRPMWIRVLLTLAVAAWFGFEVFFGGEQLWMMITGVALGYCVWNFFISFPKDTPGSTPDPKV